MKVDLQCGGRIVIDGREFKGRSVQINGNKVVVDGVTQDGELVGEIHVEVHGNVEALKMGSGDVKAQGVGSIVTGSGDVSCGNVSGSVSTASGDVVCGKVGGSVSTVSGDISRRII